MNARNLFVFSSDGVFGNHSSIFPSQHNFISTPYSVYQVVTCSIFPWVGITPSNKVWG